MGITVSQLITLAFKQAGILAIGQTLKSEDYNDAFTICNLMLADWNRRRWLINHLLDVSIPCTGKQYYTIGQVSGTTTDFNIPRPDKIQSAYFRLSPQNTASSTVIPGDFSATDFSPTDFSVDQTTTIIPENVLLSPVDFTLYQIPSYEDYADISLKSLVSVPTSFFYDSGYPIGNVYFWPIPSNFAQQYELHLIVKSTLVQLIDQKTIISLPDEYINAILWNLTCRIRSMYGPLPQDPLHVTMAKSALNTIKVSNTQIKNMDMPSAVLPRNRNGWYGGVGGIYEGTFTLDQDTL